VCGSAGGCSGGTPPTLFGASAADTNVPVFTITVDGTGFAGADATAQANAERDATTCTGTVNGNAVALTMDTSTTDAEVVATFPAVPLFDTAVALKCNNGVDAEYTVFEGLFAPKYVTAQVTKHYSCSYDASHDQVAWDWEPTSADDGTIDVEASMQSHIAGCGGAAPVELLTNADDASLLTDDVLLVHGRFGVVDETGAFVAAELGEASCLVSGKQCDFAGLGIFGDVHAWVTPDGTEWVMMLYNIDTSVGFG
jgi:hypothetical protein